MSRRKHGDSLEFGSDSFLDIIANIVGILIILIVVAGVKVARQPVEVAQTPIVKQPAKPVVASVKPQPVIEFPPVEIVDSLPRPKPVAPPTLPIADPIAPSKPPLRTRTKVKAQPKPGSPNQSFDERFLPWVAAVMPADPKPEPIVAVAPVEPVKPKPVRKPPEPIQPRPDLVAKQASLTKSLIDTKTQLARLTVEESKLKKFKIALMTQRQSEDKQFQLKQTELRSIEEQADAAKERVTRRRKKLMDLKGQLLTATQKPKVKVESLQHRLNAVSKEVVGKEIHFRIIEGRVSIVPLNELTEALKRTIQRRRSSLMRFNRHEGSVGPIRGYAMNYVVEREALSVLDQLRVGDNVARVSVSESVIEPTDAIREMTVEEALRPGSEFTARLLEVGRSSSLTFWVYPDSFKEFRVLQTAAHEVGFSVAARPLPHGTPIGISPRGTKSNAQ